MRRAGLKGSTKSACQWPSSLITLPLGSDTRLHVDVAADKNKTLNSEPATSRAHPSPMADALAAPPLAVEYLSGCGGVCSKPLSPLFFRWRYIRHRSSVVDRWRRSKKRILVKRHHLPTDGGQQSKHPHAHTTEASRSFVPWTLSAQVACAAANLCDAKRSFHGKQYCTCERLI